ncbi:MAG: HYR domain-containing protein [Microbacterium sp.]|nr:HYR domain-containing protein [Microbacterium sp.]
MASRGSRLRRGGAVIGVAALAVALTGCGPFDFENVMSQWTTTAIDCDTWTVTPKYPSMILGPATDPDTGQEIALFGVARDAADVEIYRSPAQSSIAFDAQKTPIVASFTTPPTMNPISTGYYFETDPTFMGISIGHCDGIPFSAQAYLPPGRATLTSAPPVFDVLFSEPVTGFDAADLELGGTAAPTGATVTLLADGDWPFEYTTLPDGVGEREFRYLRNGGQVYRVTIDGVTGDGTVTMRVPAGAVLSTKGDGASPNATTATVTASVDATGPELSALDDVTYQLQPGEDAAALEWTAPTASDPSGVASSSCAPASGSSFSPGTTPVTCTAVDRLGNSSQTGFTVTVLAAQEPTVSVVAEATGAVPQGGSARFAVTATDYTGATAPLAAGDYTVTSSVASDVIAREDGAFSVTFPHASPHVLTVTQTSTGATAAVTVEVTPAVTPSGGVTPRGSGGASTLPATGADPTVPAAAGALLLLAGALALIARRRRTADERARDTHASGPDAKDEI